GAAVDSTITDDNGFYQFSGLTPGIYAIGVNPSSFEGFAITTLNAGTDDTIDNDIERDVYISEQTLLESGENDPNWDIGIFAEGADILDPCACRNNATNGRDGQYDEIVEIDATPGGVWRIVAQEGMFLESSPAPPAAPIPVPLGTALVEMGPGMYTYQFIHVDSIGYTLTATDGTKTLEISNLCANPDIFFTEIDTAICLFDDPIALEVFTNLPDSDLDFTIVDEDGDPVAIDVTNIDPQQIGTGFFELIATVTPTDPMECENRLIVDFTIRVSDDCVAEIGDFVWEDIDGDGQQDDDEPGIEGVTVMLLEADGTTMVTEDALGNLIRPVTTDENGFYEFINLIPGDYRVKFSDAPDGFAPTIVDQGDDLTDSDADVTTGVTGVYTIEKTERDSSVDAGYFTTASLGDMAWFDANRNGIMDDRIDFFTGEVLGSELAAEGVRIDLYTEDGTFVASDITDSEGKYGFDDLDPGKYFIEFDSLTYPDTGYVVTLLDAGDDDTIDNDIERAEQNSLGRYRSEVIMLNSGQNDPTWDVGFFRTMDPTISDPCDCTDFVFDQDFVNAANSYTRNEVVEVRGTAGEVWRIIEPSTGLFFRTSSSTEPLVRVPIGEQLSVRPGVPDEYFIEFQHIARYDTLPGGVVIPQDETGYTIFVSNGIDTLTIGNECATLSGPAPVVPDTVCVFNTEPTILPTDVQLSRPGTTIYYVPFTNGDGSVTQQIVTEIGDPGDFPLNFAGQDPSDPRIVVGEYVPDSDDGGICPLPVMFEVVFDVDEECVAEIGDFVWEDLDGNGQQDDGEPGIQGVTVMLLEPDGVTMISEDAFGEPISSTTTDENGFYEFINLIPGDYRVKFTTPDGFESTGVDVGPDATDSDADPITGVTGIYSLEVGQRDETVDAGYVGAGSIEGLVFKNCDPEGVQNGNETPVQGATVTLLNSDNTPALTTAGIIIASVLTQADGLYAFDDVRSGEYKILVELPANSGLEFAAANQTANESLDSDINPTTGESDVFTLAPGGTVSDKDAGVIDTEAPTFTVPADVTVGCGDSVNPDDTGRPSSVEDNCDEGLIPSFEDSGSFDECGGLITRNWIVVDECGNETSLTQIITIDPAPLPVITVPSQPTDLTCETASTFSPIAATYTNGETGSCEISGSVPGVVSGDIDAC
ncbi:MAG: SdrD B-like domain-containing protein, partial [Bacteroidota bacterium]